VFVVVGADSPGRVRQMSTVCDIGQRHIE
jgi:hypothetical protein